ncbi:MAG: hypothetical protein QW193_04370 [Nitrososphaerales archaeon]
MIFTPQAKAHSGDVLSAWASVVPDIDGVISSDEWGDADLVSFTLVSQIGETHLASLYVKNDDTYLYLAVKVLNDDYNDGDLISLLFENDHDGLPENGDDWLYVAAWPYDVGQDGYYDADIGVLTSDSSDGERMTF